VSTVLSTRKIPWLNERRIRGQAIVLAICLWGTFAWIMTTPGVIGRNGLLKGLDFLHFYTLGTLASEHRGAQLYDMTAQNQLAVRRVPDAKQIYFVPLYSPAVSLLFAPLAAFSYGAALAIWFVVDTLLYAWCCRAVWKRCPNLQRCGWLAFLLALAYPAFFHLLAWGQCSILGLVCFTAAYVALHADRKFLAGFAIGCLMVKPQMGLAAAIVLVASGEWVVVLGALTGALVNLLIGWLYYGTDVLRAYVVQLLNVGKVVPLMEPRPYHMHTLRAFWSMLLPWPQAAFWIYVVNSLFVLGLTVLCWRSQASLQLKFAALLIASALVAPHLTVYDLVILAPVFPLVADWAQGKWSKAPRLGPLLYLCFLLPITGPLARVTHLQLSVIAMAALLWVIYRCSAMGPTEGYA
jgi:hypothetical protein